MISVNLAFIFLAGVVFLGFVVTALFNKFKFTSVLPLMIIGLIVGPLLKLVNSGPGSIIAQLSPYITALTVSFVLFDVGININYETLKKVLLRATGFMTLVVLISAFACAAIAFYAFGWGILGSLVFGFAIAGPSSIIVPTLVKSVKLPRELKTSLLYEGIATDSFQLIIPIILLGIIATHNISVSGAVSALLTAVLSSIALGLISALFWIYVLGKFREQSKEYSWMLTIAMVLATYGIAQEFGMNGAISIFVFGITFANIGVINSLSRRKRDLPGLAELTGQDIDHIKRYQREITFFASTFFFVYIGMLFNITGTSKLLYLSLVGAVVAIALLIIRAAFAGLLGKFMSRANRIEYSFEKRIVAANVGRGLSPAIVATLPVAFGIVLPHFLDEIFMIILFTNIVSSIGIFMVYERANRQKELKNKVGSVKRRLRRV
ncbi:MAG: cation:proton antiporter [Candidatus Micrarchaeaceae archaeon]